MKKLYIFLLVCLPFLLSAQSEIYDQIDEFDETHLVSHTIIVPDEDDKEPMILIQLKGQRDTKNGFCEWKFYFVIIAISKERYITPTDIKFSIDKQVIEAEGYDPEMGLSDTLEREGFYTTVVTYDLDFETILRMSISQTRMLFDHDKQIYYTIIDFNEKALSRLNEFVNHMIQNYGVSE